MTVERFPIERGHVMMFARAIGDHNPAYFAEEGAIATVNQDGRNVFSGRASARVDP